MKLTALSVALIAALGLTAGCSTQNTMSQPRTGTAADVHAQYALGRFYQGQQRYELAIEAYRRALAANPAHAGAHNGLGASLLLAGRTAEAIEQFKDGLRHHPRSAALWNNLGYAYQLGGENRLAETAYRQSLDLDPADPRTSANLAVALQAAPQVEPVSAPAAPPARLEAPQAAPAMTPPALATGVQTIAVPVVAVAPAVQVVEVAPRIYEMKLPDTSAIAIAANRSAPVAGAMHISVPLRDNAIRLASIGSDDFVLEIRNGNGVRHMAWRTSQYLADYGYTTKRLTNQRGFNVKITRIFFRPGYVEEATRLLAHLPKDSVLTETNNMRRGIHVRVVLGRDMVQHQAGLDSAKEKIQLAALQH